jgi:OOP family OmpA-OmpF porin
VTSAPASYSIEFKSSGFTLAAIGSAPIGQIFELRARFGLYFADTTLSQRAVISTSAASDSSSKNTQEFLYGIGAGLKLGEHWRLGLDWIRYKDVGDENETGEANVDNISASLAFQF